MKMLAWFAKMVISAVLLPFLSVFTTIYVADQYIRGFLEQWNLPAIERESFDIGHYMSALTDSARGWGLPEAADEPAETLPGRTPAEAELSGEGYPAQGESGSDSAASEPDETADNWTGEPVEPGGGEREALPVFGGLEAGTLGDSLVMSAEEFNEKRKQLTDEDKMEIFTIMMARLPQEELQRMSLLLEEGITGEEVKELEDVINAYLHRDEVARLLAILNKY